MLVLPKFRSQVVWSANFLNFIFFDALLFFINALEGMARLPITSWFDLLDISEITKLRGVVLSQENIQRLDISMNDVSRM